MTVRKTSKKEPAKAAAPAVPPPDEQHLEPAPAATGASAAKKRSNRLKAPARKTDAKKKSAAAAGKKRAPRSRSADAQSAEPSEADIRLRAYFIAERRIQLALQGDPALDWIEARRQLIEEAGSSEA
jgi:hypothetical protein